MALTITDSLMESTETRHVATKKDGEWSVSWWPEFRITRNDAITAMTLAEEIALGRDGIDGNFSAARWRRIKDWSKELDIPPLRAVHLIEGTKEGT